MADTQERKRESNAETSVWEWVVSALSAVLVLGAIGFMLHEALSRPPSPPEIVIESTTVTENATGYVVEFRARNRGKTTAQGLVVEAVLKRDTSTLEKAQVTIDYLPSEATREAGFFFSNDPREHTLEISPRGYDRP